MPLPTVGRFVSYFPRRGDLPTGANQNLVAVVAYVKQNGRLVLTVFGIDGNTNARLDVLFLDNDDERRETIDQADQDFATWPTRSDRSAAEPDDEMIVGLARVVDEHGLFNDRLASQVELLAAQVDGARDTLAERIADLERRFSDVPHFLDDQPTPVESEPLNDGPHAEDVDQTAPDPQPAAEPKTPKPRARKST